MALLKSVFSTLETESNQSPPALPTTESTREIFANLSQDWTYSHKFKGKNATYWATETDLYTFPVGEDWPEFLRRGNSLRGIKQKPLAVADVDVK